MRLNFKGIIFLIGVALLLGVAFAFISAWGDVNILGLPLPMSYYFMQSAYYFMQSAFEFTTFCLGIVLALMVIKTPTLSNPLCAIVGGE